MSSSVFVIGKNIFAMIIFLENERMRERQDSSKVLDVKTKASNQNTRRISLGSQFWYLHGPGENLRFSQFLEIETNE